MISVFDFLEDFDDQSLDFSEWLDRMIEAVDDYNAQYDTMYVPSTTVARYSAMKKK